MYLKLILKEIAVFLILVLAGIPLFSQTQERLFDQIPYKEGINPPMVVERVPADGDETRV